MRNQPWRILLILSLLLLGTVAVWLWATAPPDPVYLGKRFSECLYERRLRFPGEKSSYPYGEAIRANGVAAAPLLASWLETEHPALLLRLQDWLRKLKFKAQILPANRQDVAFETLGEVPVLGAARAIHQYLVSGNGPTVRKRAAVLYMWRFNSATEQEKKEIAAESAPFIARFLDTFERTGNDEYSLIIVGVLIETGAVPVSEELATRIQRDAEKARYLRRAVAALKHDKK